MNHNSASVYLTTDKQGQGQRRNNQKPQEACRVSHKHLLTRCKQDNKRGRNRKRKKDKQKKNIKKNDQTLNLSSMISSM